MNSIVPRKTCVKIRTTVRKLSNHPLIKSSRLLRRHVVRGATLSLVPDAVNDVAFHHAQLNLNEILHVIQDTTSITSMTFLLAIILSRLSID
jgi:hypothetical protein